MRVEPVEPGVGQGRLTEAGGAALAALNRACGTGYRLVRRLPSGYRAGAFLVRDDSGAEAVFKYGTDRTWARHVVTAAPMVAAARRQGWPTPAWLAVGETDRGFLYLLQQRVPGSSPERLTVALARCVLPVVRWQRGRAPSTGQDWSAHDRALVFADSGPLSRLRGYSPAGRRFARAVTACLEPYRNVVVPDGDLVHGDLSPDNVLLHDDRLSAVIDVAALGRGTRLHDLASLLAHGTLWDGDPAARGYLHDEVRRRAAPGEFEVCLAAALISALTAHLTAHGRPDDADDLFARAIAGIEAVVGRGR